MRMFLISVAAAVSTLALSVAADAKTFTRKVVENNDKCYLVEYIPSTYIFNTKGKKVSGESRSWVGNIADGAVIIKRRNPAVYIQTRKLLEQDHYTLVAQGC
ncbi:MAG TPA: hypothetical protein ENH55_11290 [Aurantimonas coralicida]|uniref:Uncharacterized protein n=2 Tax=root TaxID=1 RepID=A0A9C9NI35_9HYPH|nr:hypothetical protein [Aurantimonas coralicida]HEU01749.1 hypothetical protein [Aurantimonas coralicida]